MRAWQRKLSVPWLLLVAAVLVVAWKWLQPDVKSRNSESLLPEIELQEALAVLKLTPRNGLLLGAVVARLTPESLSSPNTAQPPRALEFQALSEIVLQLRPDLGRADLAALLAEHRLAPVKALPELGLLVVQVSVEGGTAEPIALAAGDLERTAVATQLPSLRADHRIVAVVPDAVLSTFVLASAVIARRGGAPGAAQSENWGLADARIPEIWPTLTDQYRVGVIDVGFEKHSGVDLVSGLATPSSTSTHGTDVAAILCGKHDKAGVRGVIPRCTVHYASTQGILTGSQAIEGSDPIAWSALFSEYIGTTLDFIRANPEVKTINLSLGYNWMTKFGIDPASNVAVRDLVKGQGRIAMALLEFAAEREIAFVSAAGNDSATLATPLDAKWASPINYAARLMLGRNRWSNVLIVEAHDQSGNRAPFSNIGGDISCPGVDVPSALTVVDGKRGTLSGTSFAAPYCAGALVAIRSVVPKANLEISLECVRRSNRARGGVPLLNLRFAVDNCKSALSETALRNKVAAVERWTALIDRDSSPPFGTSTVDKCLSLRGVFRVGPTVNLGDGRGPEIVDAVTRNSVRQHAASLIRNSCNAPALVAIRMNLNPSQQETMQFGLAVLNEIRVAGYPGGVALLEWPAFGGERDTTGPASDEVVVTIGDRDLPSRIAAKR